MARTPLLCKYMNVNLRSFDKKEKNVTKRSERHKGKHDKEGADQKTSSAHHQSLNGTDHI